MVMIQVRFYFNRDWISLFSAQFVQITFLLSYFFVFSVDYCLKKKSQIRKKKKENILEKKEFIKE